MSIEPTVLEYAKYADVQMAAEAFLKSESTSATSYSGDDLIRALKAGNSHSSIFSSVQAIEFEKAWEVRSQQPNTGTGFSGTLFRNKQTEELVMSFRSTEFIDDSARDNQATNVMEIAKFGFAFGQLRDMEAWYEKLKTQGLLSSASQLTVTGYSLGGHLASAFNLMHRGDLTAGGQNVVKQVVTFNSAGIGGYDPGTSLNQIVAQFKKLSENKTGTEFEFNTAELGALYERARSSIDARRYH